MRQQRQVARAQTAQQGFTLIELMIVVAIIAILAAIAIPQYNDYTARAQLSEAFTLADGLKTPVTEMYSQDAGGYCNNKNFPNAITSGQYVQSIGLTLSGAACQMLITMKSDNVNSKIKGGQVTFLFTPTDKPSADGQNQQNWSCKSSIEDKSILPKSCQTK